MLASVLYVGVPGTHGSRTKNDWFGVDSKLSWFLRERGVENIASAARSAYMWSTDFDGVGSGDHEDWKASGHALYYYFVPQLAPRLALKQERSNVICHSHGLQGVLYACSFGLRLNALISVAGPVRKDMFDVARRARPNIARWLHIYSDCSDRWQWLGELFDGHLGIVRRHPLADRNDSVPRVGHGGILRDPEDFHYWEDRGWITFLKGIGPYTPTR